MKASVKVQVCVYVGGRWWGRNRDNMELDFLKPSISTSLEKLFCFFFLRTQRLEIKWIVQSRLEQESLHIDS